MRVLVLAALFVGALSRSTDVRRGENDYRGEINELFSMILDYQQEFNQPIFLPFLFAKNKGLFASCKQFSSLLRQSSLAVLSTQRFIKIW
jgi:hypothetical protein